MVRLRLDAAAVSRSRFALSPLAETLGSVIVLGKDTPAKPWLAHWYRRHHADFLTTIDGDPFAVGLVRLLATTKWIPRFVAIPPPGGMQTTLDDELAAVAAMPDGHVRTELELSVANSRHDHDLDWPTGHSWGARAAAVMRSAWRRYVFPEWSARRAVLERDITYRSGLLAREGWPRALRHMSGSIRATPIIPPAREAAPSGVESTTRRSANTLDHAPCLAADGGQASARVGTG